MPKPNSLSFIFLISICMLACPVSAAKLYKWIDNEGKVHYSGTIPPQQSAKEHTELNDGGIVVDEKQAAKTREEIARGKRLRELRNKQQKVVAQQALRDQTLLKTFSTKDDLIMTRDGKIETIDVMIQLALDRIVRLEERLQTLEKKAAEKERAGGKIHFSVGKEIESIKKQIGQKHTFIAEKKHDQIKTRSRYNLDLERFQQLNRHTGEQSAKKDDVAQLDLSLVECNDHKVCATYWERAKSFIETHAPTPLELVSGSILMSTPPVSDDTFGVIVTLTSGHGSSSELFLDLRCKKSLEGKAACTGEQAQNIRSMFRPFILEVQTEQ